MKYLDKILGYFGLIRIKAYDAQLTTHVYMVDEAYRQLNEERDRFAKWKKNLLKWCNQ